MTSEMLRGWLPLYVLQHPEDLDDAEALLLEPRAVYDPCLLGYTLLSDGQAVYVYDCGRILEALTDDLTEEGAQEWIWFNMIGAYVGERTPFIIDMTTEDPKDMVLNLWDRTIASS